MELPEVTRPEETLTEPGSMFYAYSAFPPRFFLLTRKNGIQGKCWKLLRSLYSNVSNKVLFEDFESDWLDQEFGLKQGCVLSSTLFSVSMNDLVSMLSKHNLGVNLASDIIKVVPLLPNLTVIFRRVCSSCSDLPIKTISSAKRRQFIISEAKLTPKLCSDSILTKSFIRTEKRDGDRWNLKFNFKKPKVLVIGKKIDKLKRWDLGNDPIEETNVYKYLGVYFSRTLKFTYHIETFIEENVQTKLNYMSHRLSLSIFLPITSTFGFLKLNFRFHLLANPAVIYRRVCSSCSDLPIKTISSAFI
jgi:hypothetical protein